MLSPYTQHACLKGVLRSLSAPPCQWGTSWNLQQSQIFPIFLGMSGGCWWIPSFHAFVSKVDMAHFQSRKGFISTNLLAACLFCLRFCDLLCGWEGSAADSRIFEKAQCNDFVIEPGTCYLADAGFHLCDALLVPYCGVRYHLKEWEQANLQLVSYFVYFVHY